MARKQRYSNTKKKQQPRRAPALSPVMAPAIREHKPPKQYGKAFILLEDGNKNTFEFRGGAWVAYGRTIAECRLDCQVTELSQRVNQMIRYEVRTQLAASV